MSAIEIGRVGFIIMLVVLLGSPIYGYLMDRRSAFLVSEKWRKEEEEGDREGGREGRRQAGRRGKEGGR
eukprot:764647-Hanusia_phi.AAC.1